MSNTLCNHVWKEGWAIEPVVFCIKCNKDADEVYPNMPYKDQLKLAQ